MTVQLLSHFSFHPSACLIFFFLVLTRSSKPVCSSTRIFKCLSRDLSQLQCDQMLIQKVAQFCPKRSHSSFAQRLFIVFLNIIKSSPIFHIIAQKGATAAFSWHFIVFVNILNSHQNLGYFCQIICSPKAFKSSPIWSHWTLKRHLANKINTFRIDFNNAADAEIYL